MLNRTSHIIIRFYLCCVVNMWLKLCLIAIVSCPALSSVAKETVDSCSIGDIQCGDGQCLDSSRRCDAVLDCFDGSDEAGCLGVTSGDGLSSGDSVLHSRFRRQSARKCRKNEWTCRDGTCISFDRKCDGMVDCPDRSDEAHALCRETQCQPNWFRCTYGACVDGTAPCNGIDECADRSDELLARCRNETNEVGGRFRCLDGSFISASDHCDGNPDCPDGSDETVRACAGTTCRSYLFQCAYGACVDQGSDCNGIRECADGSDEADDLCNKMLTPDKGTNTVVSVPSSGKCVLPPPPDHGSYTSNVPHASPGQSFMTLQLNITCRPGYGVEGNSVVFCYDGTWSETLPKCVRLCKLNKNPSVYYHCLVSGAIQGQRECNEYEPSGTVVRPECNSPNYYTAVTLGFMRCIDGSWDYVAVCTPGLVKTGTNITLIIKDSVNIHISDFQYSSESKKPNGNADTSKYPNGNVDITKYPNGNPDIIIFPDGNTGNSKYPSGNSGATKYPSGNTNSIKYPFGNIDISKYPNGNTNIKVVIHRESTENPLDYEISEDDWRMGVPNRKVIDKKNKKYFVPSKN